MTSFIYSFIHSFIRSDQRSERIHFVSLLEYGGYLISRQMNAGFLSDRELTVWSPRSGVLPILEKKEDSRRTQLAGLTRLDRRISTVCRSMLETEWKSTNPSVTRR